MREAMLEPEGNQKPGPSMSRAARVFLVMCGPVIINQRPGAFDGRGMLQAFIPYPKPETAS
jgi:hypothetical protein